MLTRCGIALVLAACGCGSELPALDFDAGDASLTDASSANTPADAAPDAVVCGKRVHLLLAIYAYLPVAQIRTNGCWDFVPTAQEPNDYRICHYDKPTGHPLGVNWAYDDTSPLHDLTTERNRVTQCAANGGTGYEYMARRNGAWRRVDPGSVVDIFFAEAYSSEYTVDDYLSLWKADTAIGRPMINIGHIGAATIHAKVLGLCSYIGSGKWMALYSSTEIMGADLNAMVTAMDSCTK